jgi:hypothetical protein
MQVDRVPYLSHRCSVSRDQAYVKVNKVMNSVPCMPFGVSADLSSAMEETRRTSLGYRSLININADANTDMECPLSLTADFAVQQAWHPCNALIYYSHDIA